MAYWLYTQPKFPATPAQPRGYRVSFRRFGSPISPERIEPNGQRTFLLNGSKLPYNDRAFQGANDINLHPLRGFRWGDTRTSIL